MVHLTENKIESLFEQTIICAAPIGIPYFNMDQAIDFGENLMVSVGCETVECLREMDLRELIDSTWKHIIGGIADRKFIARVIQAKYPKKSGELGGLRSI